MSSKVRDPAEQAAQADPTPDTPAALDFLEQFRPGGPWVLTAIKPDKRQIQTRSYTERQECGKWLDRFYGERNIYFHANPTIRPLEKKAEREDIAALAWLHVDIDPRPREDIDQERIRAGVGA